MWRFKSCLLKTWFLVLSLSCNPPAVEEEALEDSSVSQTDDSDSETDEVSTEENSETQSQGDDTSPSGTLAIGFSEDLKPSEALGLLESSMKSVAKSEVGNTLNNGALAIALDSGFQGEDCDGNAYPVGREGEPTSSNGDLALDAPSYTQRHFFCLVKIGTSPETMIGSITINKGTLCAMEKAGAMDPSKNGIEQTVELKIDTDCYDRNFVI